MLTTVMSSAGFTSTQEREVISNTVWFLSEYNDNFKPQPEDDEELVCPSNDNINLCWLKLIKVLTHVKIRKI